MTDEQADPSPESPTPGPVSAFSFERLWLVRLLFQELPEPTLEDVSSVEAGLVTFAVGGTIALFAGAAETRLDFKITPDPRNRPYEIEIGIVARFSNATATPEELRNFCTNVVPGIVFPYVRQIVWNATLHGRRGGIALPLMNMRVVFGNVEWQEIRPPAGLTVSSNESPQPFSQ